jgi:hypothetical protein
MKRATSLLPDNLAPVGINREQAAALIGISATLFDRLVREGLMPDARVVFGRLVWDVHEVATAFRALPHRSEPVDAHRGGSNPWDDEEET